MDNNNTKVEGAQSPSAKQRKTSAEEEGWWDALYMYVKNDILELDPKLNLNRYTVMRLRGMAQGRFIGEDREKCDLTYGYKVVLATFHKMAPLIKLGLCTRQFNDLQHKVNWMLSMVEPHLNEVYETEEENKKRIEDLKEQSNGIIEDIERYQKLNKYINSTTEFKEAKTWDKKHEDMW